MPNKPYDPICLRALRIPTMEEIRDFQMVHMGEPTEKFPLQVADAREIIMELREIIRKQESEIENWLKLPPYNGRK